METTIILTPLRIISSYRENREVQLGESDVCDTVQWLIYEDAVYRIDTFFLDYDIHIYKIGYPHPKISNIIDFALDNNIKHYGDVAVFTHILTFIKPPNPEEASLKLREIGYPGQFLPLFKSYVFWSPDGKDYSTQTKPD